MQKRSVLGIFAGVILFASPAFAVIELKNPLSKVGSISQTILVGKISEVSADGAGFTLGNIEALKGAAVGESVSFSAPADLVKTVGKETPVIVFTQGTVSIVHVGDNWYIAKKSGAGFSIVGAHKTGAKDTFPGKTTALIAATRELIKTGKSPMIDALKEPVLNGKEQLIQKLAGIKDPTGFVTCDVNGDGKADLIVCAAGNVRLFISDGTSFVHATEKYGLQEARGKKLELTHDLQQRPCIRTEEGSWALEKEKFSKSDVKPLTTHATELDGGVLGKFGEGETVYVMMVGEKGVSRVFFAGDIADDVRLTGSSILEYVADKSKGLANAKAVAIDANGDGRTDLFIRSDAGNLLLLNRGYGAFLVDPIPTKIEHEGLLSSGTLDAKSKSESLLILSGDGSVYAVETKRSPAP